MGAHGEARDEDVDGSFAGDLAHVVAQSLERGLPLGGFDGDAVGAAQAETQENDTGHGLRLCGERDKSLPRVELSAVVAWCQRPFLEDPKWPNVR